MIYLTRRVTFSMAHRMHNHHKSDAENRVLYGKCNNPNGHGHEYALEATLGGTIDPSTGFCVNLVHLDQVLRREIVERFDHYDFDRDFPEYHHVVSSGENLCRLFFELLAPHFGHPDGFGKLVRVRLEETSKNSFEYPA